MNGDRDETLTYHRVIEDVVTGTAQVIELDTEDMVDPTDPYGMFTLRIAEYDSISRDLFSRGWLVMENENGTVVDSIEDHGRKALRYWFTLE
ncbi:hypothetical protein [Isoptericola sp. NPDC019482]|uniref:hypothetical protein n=1 Tax=Isoptericola sp. NPDC019482 TaxID=3154688 RepID=UPI0034701DB8